MLLLTSPLGTWTLSLLLLPNLTERLQYAGYIPARCELPEPTAFHTNCSSEASENGREGLVNTPVQFRQNQAAAGSAKPDKEQS